MQQPERIGQYHIRRLIGVGGMGSVYEAEQEHPKRLVALKVIREGVDDEEAVRRFHYEIEVLGRLKHAGIAAVYEAGTHEADGQSLPWFAMEYVADARGITDYATAHALDLKQRVRLFLDVCDAIHHGHQRGIIHRDLKPENVLVTPTGQVKLIDYGIARAADAGESAETRLTTHGQLVGTLQYMSPEQVGADPDDLDVRTDVYSLGVVLYELLAGRLPYEFRNDSVLEGLTAIREGRRTSLTTRQGISADLGLVVDKALERDRERRYQSALLFKQDLQNVLSDAPISARPPSALYQLRAFARRNKAVFAGASLALTGLVVALVVSLSMYFRADKARLAEADAKIEARDAQRAAESAQAEESKQRLRAEENEKIAAREALTARKVNRFLNFVLSRADPTAGRKRDVTVREAVALAAQSIEGNFEGMPLVEAEVQQTVARTYLQLGLHEKAAPHFERALALRREHLGPEAEDTLVSLGDLGTIKYFLGDLEGAERLMQESAAVTAKQSGAESGAALRQIQNLAFVRMRLGRYEEAERMLTKALEPVYRVFGLEDPSTLVHLNHLAQARAELGRLDEAILMTKDALARLKEAVGPTHPHTLTTMNGYGVLLLDAKRFEDARAVFERTAALQSETLGKEHPEVLMTRYNLAAALRGLGRDEAAAAVQVEVLEARKRVLPAGHGQVHASRMRLAGLRSEQGRHKEALALYEAAYAAAILKHGASSPRALASAKAVAACHEELEQPAQAARWKALAKPPAK